jgi:hypothetical protein
VHCDFIDLSRQTVPQNVTEQLVLHMPALRLADFIDSYGGMKKIRDTFSPDGFQKFYLHFFKLYQAKLHPKTNKRMMKQNSKFRNDHIYKIGQFDNPIIMDFCIRSLGFFKDYEEEGNSSFAFLFFYSKFCSDPVPDFRCPIPVLPDAWLNLLPQEVDTNVLPHMNDITYQKKPLVDDVCIEKQFFRRLLGMSESYVKFRNHETLAYGFELVSKQRMYSNLRRSKYFLYIFAMLSIVLARIHVELDVCLGFLEKAKALAHVCSQKLDILFYQQQIFHYYDIYNKETLAFEKIFPAVPESSHFYIQTYQFHFESTIYRIQNYLCQALCLKPYDTQKEWHAFSCLIGQMMSILTEEKKFVYKVLSTEHYNKEEFESSLIFLDMYIVCVNQVGERPTLYSLKEKIDCLALQLSNEKHYLKYFFNHISNPDFYDVHYFIREMNISRKLYEQKSGMTNTEQWGDLCFTLFLMFQILAKQPSRAVDYLEDSMENYKLNNSPRLKMCWHFKNKDVQFLTHSHAVTPKPCNVEQLLRTNSKVARLTKLGILSLEQVDKTEFL